MHNRHYADEDAQPKPEARRLERLRMQQARTAGLEARHAIKLARVRRGCRYSPLGEGLCGNEVVDIHANLLLCPTHAALVIEDLRPHILRLQMPRTES